MNGRAFYVDRNGIYGIWFSGQKWVLGLVQNIRVGKPNFGFVLRIPLCQYKILFKYVLNTEQILNFRK